MIKWAVLKPSLLLALLLPLFLSGCAKEFKQFARMDWTVLNNAGRTIAIKFYSQDRGVLWPSSSQHYEVNPGERQTFALRCGLNEKVCYGAWTTTNVYWGAGRYGRNSCSTCCYRCTNNNPRIRLNR